MIKQMAWNTFKNTGNINSFLEFIETQKIEKNDEMNYSNQIINKANEIENSKEKNL